MSDSAVTGPDAPASESSSSQLPISSIVRAVCQAASGGPDLLYEVMIKMSLMVEATAPACALQLGAVRSTVNPPGGGAEGLEEQKIEMGGRQFREFFGRRGGPEPAA